MASALTPAASGSTATVNNCLMYVAAHPNIDPMCVSGGVTVFATLREEARFTTAACTWEDILLPSALCGAP
jgi:hypothetical protein